MKKIISLLLITSIFSINISFADNWYETLYKKTISDIQKILETSKVKENYEKFDYNISPILTNTNSIDFYKKYAYTNEDKNYLNNLKNDCDKANKWLYKEQNINNKIILLVKKFEKNKKYNSSTLKNVKTIKDLLNKLVVFYDKNRVINSCLTESDIFAKQLENKFLWWNTNTSDKKELWNFLQKELLGLSYTWTEIKNITETISNNSNSNNTTNNYTKVVIEEKKELINYYFDSYITEEQKIEIKNVFDKILKNSILSQFIVNPLNLWFTGKNNLKTGWLYTKANYYSINGVPLNWQEVIKINYQSYLDTEERFIYKTLTHELWHLVSVWNYAGKDIESFYKISWEGNLYWTKKSGQDILTWFVTWYASTNKMEDYAESFNLYILDNNKFAKYAENNDIMKQKYDYFKNNIFTNNEFIWTDFEDLPVADYTADTVWWSMDLEKFFKYIKIN